MSSKLKHLFVNFPFISSFCLAQWFSIFGVYEAVSAMSPVLYTAWLCLCKVSALHTDFDHNFHVK